MTEKKDPLNPETYRGVDDMLDLLEDYIKDDAESEDGLKTARLEYIASLRRGIAWMWESR